MAGMVWTDGADIAVTSDGLYLVSFRGPVVQVNPRTGTGDIKPAPVAGVMMTANAARELATALASVIVKAEQAEQATKPEAAAA